LAFSFIFAAFALGGGTETDFAVDSSKTLFAVVRNEAGDAAGAGSKLCRGNGVTLGDWVCKTDVRKYDSPLVFIHEDEVYVVGRRNLSGDGRYDISTHQGALRTIQNELAYITTAKRCAVWHWDKAKDELGFVMDLPSRRYLFPVQARRSGAGARGDLRLQLGHRRARAAVERRATPPDLRLPARARVRQGAGSLALTARLRAFIASSVA